MKYSFKKSLKTLFVVSLVLVFLPRVEAQKKKIIHIGNSIGFSVVPSLHGRFMKLEGGSQQFKDSLRKADKMKSNIGFGINYRFKTGRDWYVTTGIYFSNMGFVRVKDRVNFLDTIHPNMPQSQTVIADDLQFDKEIRYYNNYRFLEFPVLFGKEMTPQRMKLGEVKLSWYFGGSIGGMIQHDIDIEFRGFSPYGYSEYTMRQTDLAPLIMNVSAIVGGRIEVDVYPKVKLFIQPQIKKHVFFASYGNEKHHLYSLSSEVGLVYDLEKDKEKKK